jgi:molybdopterin/thiamine biosynthesis adenylyltransferase
MSILINPSLADRDLRQRDLVPPERLATCHALVIGAGAIGRQVALQLAAVGVPKMTLYDDDVVGCENLAPQGYFVGDLGTAKVTATAALCRQLNPAVQLQPVADRFRRSTARSLVFDRPLIVFACVDSINTRKLLWEALHLEADFFVDGRMSAEVLRVLAVASPASDVAYACTLFDESEAFLGACTARSTIYTASIAAGLMVGQFTRWLRDLPIDGDLTFNLLASELTIASTTPC